jgi:PII-like signaling protein
VERTIKLTAFLTEDDRTGHHATAEVLAERARLAGLAVHLRRALEGFGTSRHLRAERLPDLGRGLPLVLDVVGPADAVAGFATALAELAAGTLVIEEPAPAAGAHYRLET